MVQLLLVTLPALWLAAGLGVLGQRLLPLLPLEALAWIIANAGLLRNVGVLMVGVGFLVLVLEILRHQRGVILDSALMLVGGLMWLGGASLGSGIWPWLALPIFVILFTPALTSMVILVILNGEDSIDGSLYIAAAFAIAAAGLHFILW